MEKRMKLFQNRKITPHSHGQGLVEFALLIPFLMLIVFGAVDLARAYHAMVTITNASREGARYAMRTNSAALTPAQKLDAIQQRVVDEAGSSGIKLFKANVTFRCVTSGTNIPPCAAGEPMRVTVSYNFNLLMGAFFVPSINLSRSAEMVAP
jgi:Flp pilus assembly protein TadG